MKHTHIIRTLICLLLACTMVIGMSACGANKAEASYDMAAPTAAKADGGYAPQYAANGAYTTAAYTTVAPAEMAEAADEMLVDQEAAMKAAAESIQASMDAAIIKRAAEEGITLGDRDDNGNLIIPPELQGRLIENPFLKTTDINVSTFSADVDTASYTYFRKLVGYDWSLQDIIQREGSSLRTEEMINYFDYDYTDPRAGELFGVKTRIAPCPWNEQTVLLQLGLKADDTVTTKGNNLVFLIDVSGSMRSEDKLPLLQQAFTFLTEALTRGDIVSIVTYSGREAVVLEGCDGTNTKKILNAIQNLEANGSTNGQAGIQRAYEIAKKHYIEGGNNRIIMASDGDLNVGISRADELEEFIATKRDEGIYLTTLGFGTGNYRDANMEALADNGNGTYHYIDGTSEAERIFGSDLLSTLHTVAEDVKLQVTFDQKYIAEYRLVGYENRMLNEEDFEDDTKDAGELGAGHTVTVCYELVLTEEGQRSATAKTAVDWMKLAVRHKAPGEDVSVLNEYHIGNTSYTTAPDEDFLFVCVVAELSMMLHGSEYAKDTSLQSLLSTLNLLSLDDPYKVEFRDMLKKLTK